MPMRMSRPAADDAADANTPKMMTSRLMMPWCRGFDWCRLLSIHFLRCSHAFVIYFSSSRFSLLAVASLHETFLISYFFFGLFSSDWRRSRFLVVADYWFHFSISCSRWWCKHWWWWRCHFQPHFSFLRWPKITSRQHFRDEVWAEGLMRWWADDWCFADADEMMIIAMMPMPMITRWWWWCAFEEDDSQPMSRKHFCRWRLRRLSIFAKWWFMMCRRCRP